MKRPQSPSTRYLSATQKARSWAGTFALVTSLCASHIPVLALADSEARTDAAQSISENLIAEVSPSLSHINTFFEKNVIGPVQKELKNFFDAEVEITDSAGNKRMVKRWEIELNKAKIEIPLKVSILDAKGIQANVAFLRTVIPTADGRQLRSDSFEFEIGNSHILRGRGKIKIIASKYFSLADAQKGNEPKNLKMFALKSGLNSSIPTSADDVLTKLQVGEIISLEVDGSYGLGKGKDTSTKRTRSTYGINFDRGATAIFDLSKPREDLAQVRLMGMKNKGTFSAEIEGRVALLPNLSGVIKNFLSVTAGLKINVADKILNRYPIESLLVGYDFRLSDVEGREGLQNIFNAIETFGFLKIFDPSKSDEELSKELLSNLGRAEELALAGDQSSLNNPKNFKVKHSIRAKMLTQSFEGGANLKVTNADRTGNLRGGSKTFIRYYDTKTSQVIPYMVWSDYYQSFSRLNLANIATTREYSNKQSLDFFFEADDTKEPKKLLMLVNHVEGEYSKRDVNEMKEIKNRVSSFAPSDLSNFNSLIAAIPAQEQNGVKMDLESIITRKGLEYLGNSDIYSQLNQNLIQFFDDSSRPKNLEIRELAARGDQTAAYTPSMLSGEIITNLQRVIRGNEPQYIGVFLGKLTEHEIVSRWIAPQFLSRQLPNSNELDSMFGMTLKFSSAETAQKPVKVGTTDGSAVYSVVNRLKKILTERDFEVRVSESIDEK